MIWLFINPDQPQRKFTLPFAYDNVLTYMLCVDFTSFCGTSYCPHGPWLPIHFPLGPLDQFINKRIHISIGDHVPCKKENPGPMDTIKVHTYIPSHHEGPYVT